MEIQHITEGHKGEFRAMDQGQTAGIMTYTWAGTQKIIIDHTEVNEAYKGQNVGKQMVLAAATFARESKISILPLCPFAKSVFDRTPEIRDVL